MRDPVWIGEADATKWNVVSISSAQSLVFANLIEISRGGLKTGPRKEDPRGPPTDHELSAWEVGSRWSNRIRYSTLP